MLTSILSSEKKEILSEIGITDFKELVSNIPARVVPVLWYVAINPFSTAVIRDWTLSEFDVCPQLVNKKESADTMSTIAVSISFCFISPSKLVFFPAAPHLLCSGLPNSGDIHTRF